jgi:hypothetical protein
MHRANPHQCPPPRRGCQVLSELAAYSSYRADRVGPRQVAEALVGMFLPQKMRGASLITRRVPPTAPT